MRRSPHLSKLCHTPAYAARSLVPWLGRCSIAVIDQNVDLDGQPHLLGTNIAAELEAQNFRGLTCIVTGSDPDEVAAISCSRGVHLVLEKGLSLREMAKRLLVARESLLIREALVTDSPLPSLL